MAEESTRTSHFFLRLFSTLPHHQHPQFNAAAFISAEFYHVSCFFHRGFMTIFPLAPFAFLFTSILEFLQLKYQGKDETPFDTHPIITHMGIASLLIYYLGYNLELRFSSNLRYQMRGRKYISLCIGLAGSVSLASTASILFPDSIRPVLFVIFFMLSAAEPLHSVYCRVLQKMREFYDSRRRPAQQIFINMGRILNHSFTQQGQLLPL